MRSNINTVSISGYLYSISGDRNGRDALALKTVQNTNSANYGKEFIQGNVDIATDEDGMNIVTVHFSFVTPTTKNGKPNRTFNVLKSILDDPHTWMNYGKDGATKLSISQSAIALNDFYTAEGELVSQKRNEGGYVSIVNVLPAPAERNRFTVDMLITKADVREPNEERGETETTMTVRGYIFNYNNTQIMPVDFTVLNPDGINYFESMAPSDAEPIYTKVVGHAECATIITKSVEESKWGGNEVNSSERRIRRSVVDRTMEPYEYGDENVLTAQNIITLLQNREAMLADNKKRGEEWRAKTPAAAPAPTPAKTASAAPAFNFASFSAGGAVPKF